MLNNGRKIRSQLLLLPTRVLLEDFRHCFTKNFINSIPERIHRGPTDILKALSGTVGHDPTAFHYKFPDDPFFYPSSNFMKRKLALSLESGKNAAKWIVNQHPVLFQKPVADPLIEAFLPKLDNVSDDEVTESMLEKAILFNQVGKAIDFYNCLQAKSIEVPKDTKQKLLELCCFYNCQDQEEVDLETNWFKTQKLENIGKVWKKSNFAETLFEEIGSDCPLACAAIIAGRLKYNDSTSGLELFNLCRSKGMKFPVQVYNLVFKGLIHVNCSFDDRLISIEGTLKNMKEDCIKPNLDTLNSILEALSEIKRQPQTIHFTMKLFDEFVDLGVKPSLGSFYYLLQIFFKNNSDKIFFKRQVRTFLNVIKKEKLEIQHPSDTNFFPFAMKVICILKTLNLAYELVDLLWTDDNIKFITSEMESNNFYYFFLELVFTMEPIETAIIVYRKLCPTSVILGERLFDLLLSSVLHYKEFSLIPEIWSDIRNCNVGHRLVPIFMKLITAYEGEQKDDILKAFHEMARVIYFNQDKEKFFRRKEEEHPLAASFALIACLRYGDRQRLNNILEKAQTNTFLLHEAGILTFCKFCLSLKEHSFFLAGVKLQQKDGEIRKLVKDNLANLTQLSENDLKWLQNLVEVKTEGEKSDDK